jgi:hypothetical protein
MTNRIGDRPRFPLSNQRFDKGDANSISSYYEEIISRFTGSIYGQAWGCMSNPEFSIVPGSGGSGPYITIKRCVLLYSVPIDGTLNTTSQDKGPWAANTLLFDPAKDGQPPVLSLFTRPYFTAFPAPARPWILFRRAETDTGTSNKAYWDTATNTEQIGAAELQRSEYVEFKLSTNYTITDRGQGWYRMAYIDSWGSPASASTPNIIPIHWMDSQYYADSTPPVAGTAIASALALPGYPGAIGTFGFNPATEMPELAKLLHWTVGKLGQHFSTVNTVQVTEPFAATYNVKPGAFVANYNGDGGWLSTPPRGLLELHNDLSTAEQDVIDLNNVDVSIVQALNLFLARYSRTTRLLHTLYVTPQGDGSPWEDTTFHVAVSSATNIDNSFSPNIREALPDPVPDASELVYHFTPLTVTGKKTILSLSVGTSFVLTSIDIKANDYPNISLVGREFLAVNQNYMTPTPSFNLPPSRFLQVQFVIDSGTGDGSDEMRPFTVYIYGRNV